MRSGIFYLPELHDFEHLAVVPWPWTSIDQRDWIDSLFTLEDWLNRRVGPHYSAWAYSTHPDLEYTQACVAFKESRYKTLFLLTWA
jgi:hypothetical protein